MKHLYLLLALLFLLCQCTCHKQENDTQHNAIDSTVVDDIIDSLCVDETIIHTSLTDIEKSFSISKLVNHKDIHVVCDTLYEGFAPYLDNLKFYRNDHLLYIAPIDMYKTEDIEYLSYNDNVNYLLISKYSPIDNLTLLVVQFFSDSDTTYSTELSKEIVCDIDNDGFLEIVGWGLAETICNDCDSCYYNPIIAYQFDESCHLDTTLTRELNTICYGCYLGTNISYDTICLCAREVLYNGISIWQ